MLSAWLSCLSPCNLLCGPGLVEDEGGGACLPGHVDQAGDEEELTLQGTVITKYQEIVVSDPAKCSYIEPQRI